MDDDLDPAFLDLDLLSHHTSGGGNDSLELGAEFGSQLDLDLDLDNDSAQLELGAGFGNALGAELDGLELDGAEEDDLPSGTRSRHSSGGGHGSALSDAVVGDGYATPRRRNGSGTGHGRGMSLADELASASGPPGGRTRDLMRELGIEEDDEGEERYDGEEGENEEDPEEQLERRLFGGVQQGDEGREDPFGLGGGASSPARRPGSRLRTKQSTASFAVGREPALDEDDAEEDALGISQEELDVALQEAAEALGSSIATTGTFLSHLRQHVTGEVDPSSTAPPPPHAPPSLRHSPSSATLLTGSLQRSTSTPSPSPDVPPSATTTIDYTDRQPVVESLASSVLKQLYDVASQRERQLRELTEMERVFARSDLGWQAVLAGLDPLPGDDDEEEEEEERDDDAEPAAPNGVLPPDTAFPSSPLLSPTLPPPTSFHLPPTNTLSPAAPLLPPLTDLRTLTSSLLSTLSSISDLSQVQSALSSDAGRKLRALKAQVGGVREELLVVERSEGFLRDFEERERMEKDGGGRRESCAEQARREVEAAREALEEGWRKAQSVFQVPQQPSLPMTVEVGVAV